MVATMRMRTMMVMKMVVKLIKDGDDVGSYDGGSDGDDDDNNHGAGDGDDGDGFDCNDSDG